MIPNNERIRLLILASAPVTYDGRPLWWWRAFWRLPPLLQREMRHSAIHGLSRVR